MIYKDINYADTPKVTVAEFGNGTIQIASGQAFDNSYKGLYMKSQKEPKVIGAVGDPASNTDEFKPEIVITFSNEESFSVFEEYVKNIRAEFDKEKI